MQVGDLVKWIDYKPDIPVEHIGIVLKFYKSTMKDYVDWSDMVVLSGGKQQSWTSWQCEVIHESR